MYAKVPGQQKVNSLLDCIGATPLVRLNRLPASLGIKAQVYAKLEFLSPGGSIKDRIAKRMVEKAEQDGKLKPGDTLIEASSGNTGIAIAIVAAIKGYKCVIVLSDKTSFEKEQVLHVLGARVVRISTGTSSDSPGSIVEVARRLQIEIPSSHMLNQYKNPENPAAHEFGIAEELWEQTGGSLDAIVSGAGTGGTLTGTSRGLKRHNPNIFVVGADPVGSILAKPDSLNQIKTDYRVEGIGNDFIPDVLDQAAPDLWVKTYDRDSFQYARRLAREEGILCGGSAGATIAALVHVAEQYPGLNTESKVIVVILPDGLQNYLTKFANESWMTQQGNVIKCALCDGLLTREVKSLPAYGEPD